MGVPSRIFLLPHVKHDALFVEGDPNQEPGSKGDGAVGEKKEGRKRDSQAVRNQKNKENLATLVNIFTIATMQYLCNILLRKKPRGVSHKKNGKVEVVEERGGGGGGGLILPWKTHGFPLLIFVLLHSMCSFIVS